MRYFKRPGYSKKGNYTSTPLWHLLERVERQTSPWSLTYVAKCGYVFRINAISAGVDTRDVVKTKSLRCSKCDKKAEVTVSPVVAQ